MAVAESLLPGTFNARDLGGLRAADGVVRSGVVVRSDAPVRLGDAGREVVRALGVRTAIDLREPVERELDPPDLDGLGVTVVQRPIIGHFDLSGNVSLEEIYMRLLAERGAQLTEAVAQLAEADPAPTLLFCSAGKDRTGIVSALTLGAAGVLDDEIVADYQRTEENMAGPFRAAIEARAIAAGLTEQEIASKVGAPAALMRAVLERLRCDYGDAAGYLRAHGLEQRQLALLRRRLLVAR
jgi:protein-tyrosine phosphatase